MQFRASPSQLLRLNIGTGTATPASGGPDDLVVTGRRTLGDAVAGSLVRTQAYLDDLERSNPTLKKVIEVGITLGKGPIGALGSYAFDQAVGRVIAETGLDEKAARLAVLLGTTGLSILSTSDLSEERATAERDATEASTLTKAGVTILGVASVAKVVRSVGSGRGTATVDAPDVTPGGPIRVGEVVGQTEFNRRSVVGDNIEGDHIPSAAALVAAKERELGRSLSKAEKAAIKAEGTVVAVPAEVHADSRTFRGRNTREQIKKDAADLIAATCKDTACLADNLKAKGYKQVDIDRIIADIKAKPILPPKAPPTPPLKPTK